MIDNNHNENNLDKHIDCPDNLKESELSQSSLNKDNVFDSKDNEIVELKKKITHIQEQERDTILRLTAEIENIHRRNMQEIEKTHKFALERFIFELLPVIDNLERTLTLIESDKSIVSTNIIEGINLTLKSFLDTIRKFGVESVQDIDVVFNPDIHQAISTVASDKHASNQVLSIIQKGYLLNGRLIRPAMVTVSKLNVNN